MKLRLMDTAQEVEAVARVLRQAFDVVEESADYANRDASRMVRRYVDVRLRDESTATVGTASQTAAAVRQLLAEVDTALGDDHADRTYTLESVERQLTALLDVLDGTGVQR